MHRLSVLGVLLAATALGACGNIERLGEVGSPPRMSQIGEVRKPAEVAAIRYPTADMPPQIGTPNSIWRQGSKSFFKDQRASRVGDIVTVAINLSDSADFSTENARTRADSSNLDLGALFGYRSQLLKRLPSDGPSGLLNSSEVFGLSGKGSFAGTGAAKRSESVKMNLAAVIIDVLPNGNLVIRGYQQTRVSNETRYLTVSGVIRAQDITRTNTVAYDKIADANLSYVSSGEVSTATRSKVGTGILGRILPF